jgi:hypothetical protein
MLICVCLCILACQESLDKILGDKPLISEVVLSQYDRVLFSKFVQGAPPLNMCMD